jgi:Ulp1 family protease
MKRDKSAVFRSLLDSRHHPLLKYDDAVLEKVKKWAKCEDSITVKGESLSSKQVASLLIPDQWLSSDHINAYLALLTEKHNHIYAFPTYLYAKLSLKYNFEAVQRWTKKTCIFDRSIVYVPVNVTDNHWLLVVIWIKAERRERIEIWDTMGGTDYKEAVGNVLKKYLKDEYNRYKDDNPNFNGGIEKDFDEWPVSVKFEDSVPHSTQSDSGSCGVFVCLFAKALAEHYKESDIMRLATARKDTAKKYRNVMAVELYQQTKNLQKKSEST